MNRSMLKFLSWSIALVLIALPVVGVLNGWFATDRWPVKFLTVEAEYDHVSAEQIRAAAATHLGTGFFALNLEDVRSAVAALPWIENVEARKQWPDTLVLKVRERQPFARWGDQRLIGRDGVLFSIPGSGDLAGLPQLDGPDDRLADVVDFYTTTQKTLTGTGMILSGVSLSGRGSWTLALAGGAQILLGHDNVEKRLQRFLSVYPRLGGEHTTGFQHADLRYTNGFAILWVPSTPSTPIQKPAAQAAAAETHS
ncbi:MAG: cell division protein FtsQ/DivIB [Rudaea sp.]